MKYEFYTLSRYLFLKIERNYSTIVEKSGVTLPQLRVLWIINAFPGANSSMISKIGCWTRPTVTKIIKILISKNLVQKDLTPNKKSKSIHLTAEGSDIIEINKQTNNSNFPLLKLLNHIDSIELNELLNIYSYTAIKSNNVFILDYIERINTLSLKIQYETFPKSDQPKLKNLVALYNLLRVFVLSVENAHSLLLKDLNLTYPQLRALKIIKAFKGITSVQLSELALWSPSSANLVVKNLYGKGLLYKNKGPVKNSLHIYITEKAENVIIRDAAENENKISTLNMLNDVPEEKLKQLNVLLHSLNESVNNHMVVEFIDRCLHPVNKL